MVLPMSNDLVIFQRFYKDYENKENIIYMYFTSNLLHYVAKSSSLVPKDINLVLIMAGVTDEEESYVGKVIKRPYVRLQNVYRDGYIWEMLFMTNHHNFGWLDIDAFIFNESIFYEMIELKDEVAVNSVWNRKYLKFGIDEYFANTFFQFHNIKCIKQVLNKYENITPIVCEYEIDETIDYFYSHSVPDNLRGLIIEKYPEVANRTCNFYDTTYLYQIFAFIEGYKVGRVRELCVSDQYYSNEAIHLGSSYFMYRIKLRDTPNRIYFRFNMRYSYALLIKYIDNLPNQYQEYRKVFEENMLSNKVKIDMEDVNNHITAYLKRHGLSEGIYCE